MDHFTFVATLPARDLARARGWYRDKLGLEPVEEHDWGLIYRAGGTTFQLYPTSSGAPAEHTLGAWLVDDIEAVVAALRARGLEFEEYDLPGLRTEGGIADLGYERAAWFRDSEGNILSIGQLTPG